MYFVVTRTWDWGDGDPRTEIVCAGPGRPKLFGSRAAAQEYADQWGRRPIGGNYGWSCIYAVEPWGVQGVQDAPLVPGGI